LILNRAKTINFFGFSLGETDHMYFKDFFMSKNISKNIININFYNYGEDNYDKLHIELDDLTGRQLSKFKINNNIKFIDTSKS
jgi:hypothetical protein